MDSFTVTDYGYGGRFQTPEPSSLSLIATGVAPARHGITSSLEVRPDGGGVQPVGARSWRAKSVWQTLATSGVETALVGCPGLAPATAWPGTCVDERYALPAGSLREAWPLSAGLYFPAAPAPDASPAAAAPGRAGGSGACRNTASSGQHRRHE